MRVASTLGAAAASAFVAVSANAGTQGALLMVGATVVPSVRLEVLHLVPVIDVTADDVRRGYVEVRDAARLRVTSSSRGGFRLEHHTRLPIFRSLEVMVDGVRARLGPEGGTLVSAGRVARDAVLRADWRLELADGVVPGRYPMPVALDARPF